MHLRRDPQDQVARELSRLIFVDCRAGVCNTQCMTKTTAQQNLSDTLKSITLARIHANVVLAQVRK